MKELTAQDDFMTEVNRTKVTLVDFSATWCGPCKRLTPLLEKLAMEYEARGASVSFLKVDVDQFNDIAQIHDVRCMPTMVLYVDGQLTKHKLEGLPKSMSDLEKLINGNLSFE